MQSKLRGQIWVPKCFPKASYSEFQPFFSHFSKKSIFLNAQQKVIH